MHVRAYINLALWKGRFPRWAQQGKMDMTTRKLAAPAAWDATETPSRLIDLL